jgi:hypothetical protein
MLPTGEQLDPYSAAHTRATHNDLGAIIAKVTPDAARADFYRQCRACIKTQTLMHLWPNGHVPPEYLPTVGAAPPAAVQPALEAPPRPYTDADFAADALFLKQTPADHGAYAFKHLEVDGRVSFDVIDGVLSV